MAMKVWILLAVVSTVALTTVALATNEKPKRYFDPMMSPAYGNDTVHARTIEPHHKLTHGGIPFSLPNDYKLTSSRSKKLIETEKFDDGKTGQLEDLSKAKDAKVAGHHSAASKGHFDSLEQAASTPQDTPVTLLASVLKNPKVRDAALEKGIEVLGKMVDKTMENIEAAQKHAKDFLKKKLKFKMKLYPGRGIEDEQEVAPPNYDIQAEVDNGPNDDKVSSAVPTYYPAGIGQVMMNGCYGNDYKDGDPCFDAVKAGKITACQNMIDGAAFIGVGFDGRGVYGEESRKMSIIQRDCAGFSTYENFQVPDTMNVHGIYDTTASMFVFESSSEYQHYLEEQSGTSGSFLSFSAGVKSAYGSSTSSSQQTYLAIFDVDVDRYEIFKDEVKPKDLSIAFLREFMGLPENYYSPGAPEKLQDFILRWGTHFIKSAKFGGQLEFRKLLQASQFKSKTEVQEEMEVQYNALFWSAGTRSSKTEGESEEHKKRVSSSSLRAQGGRQEIASILSDTNSPTFKQEFKTWLETIPDYPKAFKFTMGSITELVNFRSNDLFPDEEVNWGCEFNSETLKEEEESGKKYYEAADKKGETKRHYCEYKNRNDLETKIKRKRAALKRAIQVYMEEGPISTSEISLHKSFFSCQTDRWFKAKDVSELHVPAWADVKTPFRFTIITFDLPDDLYAEEGFDTNIYKNMRRLITFGFIDKKWYTSGKDYKYHTWSGYDNCGSGALANKIICVFGLCLQFKEDGTLTIPDDATIYAASKKKFPKLPASYKGKTVARLESQTQDVFRKEKDNSLGIRPCNVHWSNAYRIQPKSDGECVYFSGISKGSIYVIFSIIPNDMDTWYYCQIAPYGVAMYKAQNRKVETEEKDALGLGDSKLYQSYFVCLRETEDSTVIEYGKSSGDGYTGDVYLSYIDTDNPLDVRFYGLGNGDEDIEATDLHTVPRLRMNTKCKGKTHKDEETQQCVQTCHVACDPLHGCEPMKGKTPAADECKVCRTAIDPTTNKCLEKCPSGKKPDKARKCQDSVQLTITAGASTNGLIKDIDLTQDFTICMWMKLDFTQVKEDGSNLLEFGTDDYALPLMELTLQKKERPVQVGSAHLIIQFKVQASKAKYEVHESFTKKWFMFCLSRVSETGKVLAYINNEKQEDQDFGLIRARAGVYPTGPWDFYIEPSLGIESFLLSDFNIWDRILDAEREVLPMHKTCGAKGGNKMDWYDISSHLVKKYSASFASSPSTCTPSS